MRKLPLPSSFPSVRQMIVESKMNLLESGGGDDVLPPLVDDMDEYVAWLKSAFASLAAVDSKWGGWARTLENAGKWGAFAKNAMGNGVYTVSSLRKWVESHIKKRVRNESVAVHGRGRSKLMESHWEEDTVIDPSLPGGGHGRYEFDDNGDLVDYESDEDVEAREKLERRFRKEKFARGEFKPYINGSTPLYLVAVLMLNGGENIILADREPSVDEVQSYIDEVMGAKYSNQKGKTFIGTSNPGYIVADARLITQKEAEKIDPDFEDSVYINGRLPPLVSGSADYSHNWYRRDFG